MSFSVKSTHFSKIANSSSTRGQFVSLHIPSSLALNVGAVVKYHEDSSGLHFITECIDKTWTQVMQDQYPYELIYGKRIGKCFGCSQKLKPKEQRIVRIFKLLSTLLTIGRIGDSVVL
jgi:hypothetical protein